MAHEAHADFTAEKEAHRSSLSQKTCSFYHPSISFICVGDVPLLFPFPIPCFDHIFLADTGPGSTMWTCALCTHTWTLCWPNNWRLPLGTLYAILPTPQRRAHQHALKQSTTAPLLHQFILTSVTSLAHAACWYCSSKDTPFHCSIWRGESWRHTIL